VLRITMNEPFLAEVNRKADRFRQGLEAIREKHAAVFAEIRQLGLFVGLRFVDAAFTLVLSKALFDNGLYAIYSANDKRVLQFLPPLTITDAEMDEALAILDRALGQVRRRLKYRALRFVAARLSKEPV
jgi:acetylornithine/succinyldiaminopimelate/putrescine aminotransferase